MKDDLLKVEGEADYIKDPVSGAVLYTNVNKVNKEKQLAAQRKNKQNEIEALKSEVKDIKDILTKIVEKLQ
jgi:DNA-binding transcriptional regulator GbsR (MarR family)